MAHHLTDEEYKSQKSAVWRSTIILSIVTLVEIGFALMHYNNVGGMEEWFPKSMLNLLMVVLSLLKAYFIVGEFMHIKYETRALTLTILVPLVFLVYGVIMFMWEGSAWNFARSLWG